ncbi:hypothetical protein PFICI_10494 [Pestalotiopsis fici W106-1]|uniref:non-specific serine/threonine protein kinase n=1 Tax=Pestalotiopsis fici (strain W106-1 / CGMCC3.15140) TaxID=1229662 RepID=W3WZ81_PESFW|nr:uncharacterized protein PFICI_10494 [Pestalotiopsis fici W106-1]ETS78432.1 hypothetical protein PFICI_10494 [Pestalotiopsis fici W106-1]
MADRLPEAFRQAKEQILSRGQKISVRNGQIEYDEAYFMRPGRASRLLATKLESTIFGSLLFPSDEERRDFADKILRPPGLATILLTILANGTPSMVQTFERRFLRQTPPCTHSDLDLPFSKARAEEIFGQDGSRFYEIQSRSDATTLIEGSFEQTHNPEDCLPYLDQDRRGNGSYGTVYMVRIERGYYNLGRVGTFLNTEVMLLARKDFEPDEDSFASFQTENDIFKSLHDTNPPSSIMRALCSITMKIDDYQFPTASIFSEPADLDLWQYLMQERKLGPNERIRNLQQMLHIGHGLKWLNCHEKKSLVTGNYEEVTYVHGDLKPDNIFIYPDPKGPHSVVFKIGDFGEACLLTRSKDQMGVRRPNPQVPRIGTYWAPETQEGKIGTKSDVWSYGCILLLVLLYNHQKGGGPEGITKFATRRAEALGDGNKDVFYRTKRPRFPLGQSICNRAVGDCIESMISNNKKSTNGYDQTATKILEYLDSNVLVREERRAEITKVCRDLGNIMDEKPAETHEDHNVSFAKYPFENSTSLRDSYCRHSPDGHVFCYSAEQIVFYYPNGRIYTQVEKGLMDKRLKWSDEVLPNSRACGTSAICIVHKTATKDSAQLSIQYFGQTDKSTPVRLAEVTSVNGVSLSHDQKFLAVACESSRPGRLNARVRMYRVSDFIVPNRLVNTATMSTLRTFVSTSSAPIIETQDDQLADGEIKDVQAQGHVDLLFSSDGKTLYHAHRRKHQAVITMWGVETNEVAENTDSADGSEDADKASSSMRRRRSGSFIAQSVIKDELTGCSQDINYNHIFITGIVPLYGLRGFLAVTHEKYIIQRIWSTNRQSWTEATFEAMRGLKTILVTRDNSRLVMLATPNGHTLEIYVSALRKKFEAQRLVTKDEIRYDPRKDSAYLSETADKWLELQVASKQKSCVFTYRFKVIV